MTRMRTWLSLLAATMVMSVLVSVSNAQVAPEARKPSTSTHTLLQRLKASVHPCQSELIQRESGWRVNAWNRKGSGAYGLPQALPGHKMSSEGADWRTNPVTQIRWMSKYMR